MHTSMYSCSLLASHSFKIRSFLIGAFYVPDTVLGAPSYILNDERG